MKKQKLIGLPLVHLGAAIALSFITSFGLFGCGDDETSSSDATSTSSTSGSTGGAGGTTTSTMGSTAMGGSSTVGGGSAAGGSGGSGGVGGSGTVDVYPPLPADLYKSDRYTVRVVQGSQAYESYVIESVNDLNPNLNSRAEMTDSNHWSSFSFDGAIDVEVTLPLRASITTAVVRPLASGITPTVQGNKVTFQMTRAANLYLEIDGESEHPLFVFGNPLEVDVPSPNDPNVIFFGPGIHDVGKTYQDLGPGTVVYLAGGAYVKGLFRTATNANPVTFRGRGILSGIDYPHMSNTWDSHFIEIVGSPQQTDLRIEGITFTDGPKSAIITRGNTTIDNIKAFGWHQNTDGIATGPDSTVRNSFFKLNDDVIKLYDSNIIVSDNVIWQQPTGSAFMLSWNLPRDVSNVSVSDIDFIHFDREQGTSANLNINNSVLSCRNLNGGSIEGVTFERLRLETRPFQLVVLRTQGVKAGFTSGLGDITNVVIKDVESPAAPRVASLIDGNGSQTGAISNVTFDSVFFGGQQLTGTMMNGNAVLVVQGNTSNVNFQ